MLVWENLVGENHEAPTGARAEPLPLLSNRFLLDDHLEMRGHFFVQLDGDGELAHCLQRLVYLNLAPVNVEPFLRERIGYISGSDGAKQLVVLPGTALERNRQAFKLLG